MLQNGRMSLKCSTYVAVIAAAAEQFKHRAQVHVKVFCDILAHHIEHIAPHKPVLRLVRQICHRLHIFVQKLHHLQRFLHRYQPPLGPCKITPLLVARM